MVSRTHPMPFGTAVRPEGRVRFRLWAPGARAVEILLGTEGCPAGLAMSARPDGWFECTTPAGPGTRYRYRVDGGLAVPDPASRSNPDGVHGASEVIDPARFPWEDGDWRGRPWEEAVIYELHVGTFSPEGTYAGVERRLDDLVALGVTALELMPLAAFPGTRDWGYDGVLPFAPAAAYGRPDDLKRLVQAAHRRGLMVLLDVVYNHFGSEGNYLWVYARDAFFSSRHHTPWGPAINFDGPDSATVRRFFVENALCWIEEYGLDGLRLDAVHAIVDDSPVPILEELAQAVRAGPGRRRAVHLILENDANQSRYLRRGPDGRAQAYDAQWNDDLHHALHVILTGERDGYYQDYAKAPLAQLGRCLAEGFAYQGEPSDYREGQPRGEASARLPPTAFVGFLQNHDQVGNRACGERLSVLAAPQALALAEAIVLLAPAPPLLFMGQEFGASTPFLYFCAFGPELAEAVTEGRRREFARFPRFADPAARRAIPDPNAPETFARSRLDWDCRARTPHAETLQRYQALLALRRDELVGRLPGIRGGEAHWQTCGTTGLVVDWRLGDGCRLGLRVNAGPAPLEGLPPAPGRIIHTVGHDTLSHWTSHRLPPWSGVWCLATPAEPAAADHPASGAGARP